jgi:uncharacterized protein (UPF0147 family)
MNTFLVSAVFGRFKPAALAPCISAARFVLLCALMLLSAQAREAFAQTATSSIFPANPTYVDAVTGIVTIPAVAGQAPVTGMIDYTIDGGPVATATVTTGTNYVNLGQLPIGSHVLTFQPHPQSPSGSTITPPPPVTIPVTDQSFGFVGVYGRFNSNYTDANLFSSAGIAIDSKDTVWIADSILSKLVSFDVFGNINNVAIASLPFPIANPAGLAFDSSDNLFIADHGNSRIIKYTSAGVETVLPISGLGKPGELMLDKVRNLLYIVDQDNERVVRYDLSAMALAGSSFTNLTAIQSIALDPAGNVYVSDKLAGFFENVNGAVSGLSVNAPIQTPGGIFVDRAGLLYLTDSSINGTYRIDAQGHQTQISDFDSSFGMAEDSRGRIYFGPSTNVRTFTPAGELGVVAATTSIYGNSDQNNALVYTMPQGQTSLTQVVSPSPTFVYDVNTESCPYVQIRGTCYFDVNFQPKVPGVHQGTIATTLPGGPTINTLLYGNAVGPAPAFSPGTQTQTPSGALVSENVALDEAGNYYVSDASTNQVFETSGGVTFPLGFTGLTQPTKLAVDGAGAVYVLDGFNRIVKLDRAGNQTVPVVAGTSTELNSIGTFALDGGGQIYYTRSDPTATSIYLYDRTGATSLIASDPLGYIRLALDPYGNIYACNYNESLIRIDINGKQSTVAIKGTFPSLTAVALAVDASDTVYVAAGESPDILLVYPDGTTASIPVPALENVHDIAIDGTGSILAVDIGTNNFTFVDRTHQDFNFGNVPVNATTTFSAFFGNAGSEPFQIITLPGDSDFQQVTTADACSTTGANATVAAGSSCDLSYTVAPTALGTITATSRVTTTASVDFDTFTENAVNAPVLTLTPASYDFGSVASGNAPTTTLTLKNSGNASATVSISLFSKVSNDPSNPLSSFSETSSCPTSLAAGASCGIVVTFTPVAGSQGTATVSVTAAGTAAVSSTLTGTGAPGTPVLTLTPATYDFGAVQPGNTPTTTLTLKNTGTANAAPTVSLYQKVSNDPNNPLSSFSETSNCPASLAPGASCGIVVTFNPVPGNQNTATVSVIAAGAASVSATLTGTGAAPILSLTPASYDFGTVASGNTPSTTLTLKNSGNAPAAITVSLFERTSNDPNNPSSSFTETFNCPTSLAAGASCAIVVTFDPVAGGQGSATLSVNAPGAATVSSTLTGTGAPAVTAIDFGTGFSTSALTLNGPATITGGALQLTSGPSSAASSAFFPNPAVTTTFATDFTFQLLDPATEGITFTIQGDGAATVGSNGGGLGYQGIPNSIALKFDLRDTAGEGVDSTGIYVDGAAPTVPATSLADSGIDLHSGDLFALHIAYDGTTEFITLTDTVTNASWTTQAAEDIPSIVGGSSAYFGFTAGTGAVSADAVSANYQAKSQTKSLTGASAKPADVAATAASSTAASIVSWTYNTVITPATLAPTALNFGNVTVGSTSGVQIAELTNTGTAQFQVASITPSDPAIVVHSSYCARPVTPGTYCKLEVTLAPSAGPFSGTVVINYYLGDGTLPGENLTSTLTVTGTGVVPSVTLTPASADFGSVLGNATSSPQTFTVTNNGASAVTITRVTIADDPSLPFQIASGATCVSGGQLAAGKSCAVTVAFAPTVAGANLGALYISYLDTYGRAVTLASSLTGTGVQTATLTPTSYNFGNVTVGSPTSTFPVKSFTLINTGTVPLTVAGYSVSGTEFPDYGGGNCPASLAAGQNCTITSVVFGPLMLGPATGSLSVVTGAGTLVATLSGTVVPQPNPTLTPSSYNFGNVTLGQNNYLSENITLTNPGTADIEVVSYSVSGTGFYNGGGGNCGNLPSTLAAGQSCTITSVVFAPGVSGPATGSISVVTGTVTGNVTLTASLTGTGVAPSAETPFIDLGTGFTADALTLTGPVNVAGGALELTSGPSSAASSAFYPTPVPTSSFTTDFTFQLLDPTAEGITFTIQGDGPNAVGLGGGGLGYQGLAKSIAVKFDLKDTAGEGVDSTGIYVDGAAPTVPAVSLASSGIDLHSGDTFDLRLTYDGTTMTVNLTDTVTNATWSTKAAEDIPSITGGSTAYFGFTAGSGTPTLSSDAAEATPASITAITAKTARAARSAAVTADATPAPATSNILTWIYVAGGKTPAITWPVPAPITYGTALSGTQLNAASAVPGSFTYSPGAGTVPHAGIQTLTATFTPSDTSQYVTATAAVPLTVNKAATAVTWSAPAPISYGTALSSAQLNATATVPGTFYYNAVAGEVLAAGTHTLSVTFIPTDAADYLSSTASVTLTVNPGNTPAITWALPPHITYGTALSAAELNATSSVPGSFSYSPAAGTVPKAGIDRLSVTFTPTDTAHYTTATAEVLLVVNKATPSVTWAAPAPISYGTGLSAAQLNASSTVAGTFYYNAVAGELLTVGTHTLSVTLFPADTDDYLSSTATVSLTVTKGATP